MCQRTDNIKKIKELKNDNNEVKEENKDTFIINIISKKKISYINQNINEIKEEKMLDKEKIIEENFHP